MNTVNLRLGAGGGPEALSLSAAGASGDYLFLAPDEGAAILRLRQSDPAEPGQPQFEFGEPASFPLADLLDLPGDPGDELDLEGMAVLDDAIWLAGSHGAVRKRVKAQDDAATIPDLLKKLSQPVSRCLLARIPLTRVDGDDRANDDDQVDGATTARGPRPLRRSSGRVAARLPGKGPGSLRAALADDPHLGPFLAVAGKENGLDIEGLAVTDSAVLLGFRGPVLRGYAVVLEIDPRPDPDDPSLLRLTPLAGQPGGSPSPLYRKHFLDLDGLGIRDLARAGDDLLVLAGPTMLLDGPTRILRIAGAARDRLPEGLHRSALEQVGDDLVTGAGNDHPEALALVQADGEPHLLIVYDSPSDQRAHDGAVRADLHPLK